MSGLATSAILWYVKLRHRQRLQMSAPSIAEYARTQHAVLMAGSALDQAIGGRLQRLREARKLTMQQLADRCPGGRVTASQINKLEKGRQQFSAKWMERLAQAVECEVDELLHSGPIYPTADAHELASRIRGLSEPDRQAIERIVDTLSQASPRSEDEDPER